MIGAVALWAALEAWWQSSDALIQGGGADTFHAWCPACGSRPERTLDIVVVGTHAGVWPRCGCDRAEILRALDLSREAA